MGDVVDMSVVCDVDVEILQNSRLIAQIHEIYCNKFTLLRLHFKNALRMVGFLASFWKSSVHSLEISKILNDGRHFTLVIRLNLELLHDIIEDPLILLFALNGWG